MQNYLSTLSSRPKGNVKIKKETFILISILLLAGFLRLWRIEEYLPFLGDEGRDVRVVARFLQDFDLMFIGPRTSIGDMYLGPLYYYLVAPFLLAFNFSPIGPAIFVALLGTGTVGLVWYVAREWFGKVAAFSAALLYAISPMIIDFSRHSWNPNIMPFFALLYIYSIWRIWQKQDFKWLIVAGVSFAACLQSHYLGLLLLPTLFLVWIFSFRKYKTNRSKFLLYSLYSVLLFFILMSPLFLFDYKHGWQNFESAKKFFFERQTTVSAKPWHAIPQLWPFWQDEFMVRILSVGEKLKSIATIALLGTFIWIARSRPYYLLSLWALTGLIGLGLLKQNIYDHYFGFLFPVPFLVTGAVAQGLWDKKKKWLVIVLVIVLAGVNLQNNPLKRPPQRQMQRVQEIDKRIIEESKGETFNFGLIAKRNYEEGYLYFFEQWGANVREIDPQNMENTLTQQLFVVCEDPICEPINHPKAEIANFGWAKIEREWEVSGFKLFKLVHRGEDEKI